MIIDPKMNSELKEKIRKAKDSLKEYNTQLDKLLAKNVVSFDEIVSLYDHAESIVHQSRET